MLFLRSVAKCNSTCFHAYRHLAYFYSSTCCTTSTSTSTNGSYANYFVDSLGFSRQQALSISAKLSLQRRNKVVDFTFVANATSVVTLFRNLGFHDVLIRNIVSMQPRLLVSNVESRLKPKIRALQDQDLSRSDIIRVISRHPVMLLYGLEPTILPVLQILRQVMGSIGIVVNVIERLSGRHFRAIVRCLLPNVALLTSYGVPIELIWKQLLYQPGYLVQNTKVFEEMVMRADKKLGITPYSPMFPDGINLLNGVSEKTSYAKYLVHSLGFSNQLALSISAKLSLRRNKVNYSKFVANATSIVTLLMQLGFHDTLIRYIVFREPQLLTCNAEKTLKPKIRALQDENFTLSDVIRAISRLPTILVCKLESTIVPTIQILRQVMGSVTNVVNVIERLNGIYFRNIGTCLLPNVTFLSNSFGVSIELIRKQLLYKPGYFLRNPEVFKDIVMRADKKLGITRLSPLSLYDIILMSAMGDETLEPKCLTFKRFAADQSFSNYLVYHLGFSHQQALSTCTKLSQRRKKMIDSKFVHNAKSVVNSFHQLGFDDILLRHIVSKQPRLLASNFDKTLIPKIRVLQEEEFSGSDIIRVISRCPAILFLGMESTTLPAIQIIRQVMGSNCYVVNIIERFGESYFHHIVKSLVPNVALLTSYGVPIELIRKQLLRKPAYYVQNPEVFKDIVMRVEKRLGITRDSPMFLHGIHLISGRTEETIESKCRIFKSFGWTQFDIKTFIMKNASCFTFSDECFKNKLNFLMNELQLKPAYLTSHNCFITCSLEKRVVPRHKILLILKEKGLLKKNISLYSVIGMSEPCFLKKLVLPFKEIHEAYSKITGCSLKMLTQQSSVSIS